MTSPEDRAILIKKLLNKAEAKGTTAEERDTYNAKATKLMIQWGIEEAMLRDANRSHQEQIIQRIFYTDAPASYAHEMCQIGARVAEALGCQAIFHKIRGSNTALLVIGFEADVERTGQLFASLTLQCTLELSIFMVNLRRSRDWSDMSGTDRFNARRGFINGFSNGSSEKLKMILHGVIAETPGTELVLHDRSKQISAYVDENIATRRSIRRYDIDASGHGHAAGQRADVGQGTMGGQKSAIGE